MDILGLMNLIPLLTGHQEDAKSHKAGTNNTINIGLLMNEENLGRTRGKNQEAYLPDIRQDDINESHAYSRTSLFQLKASVNANLIT